MQPAHVRRMWRPYGQRLYMGAALLSVPRGGAPGPPSSSPTLLQLHPHYNRQRPTCPPKVKLNCWSASSFVGVMGGVYKAPTLMIRGSVREGAGGGGSMDQAWNATSACGVWKYVSIGM
eukprot:357002-Chlamydomonas_euryale.AAC.4